MGASEGGPPGREGVGSEAKGKRESWVREQDKAGKLWGLV